MKLSVKTSGGIGNIQLQGLLDTDELPGTLAHWVHTVLNPARLASARVLETTPIADAIQYQIGFFLNSGFQQFEIDEANATPEVLDVVQELVQEIIRRKQAKK